MTADGVAVFVSGKLTPAAAAQGLTSARYVSAGSTVSLEFATTGSGRWGFVITGRAPTVLAVVSATAGAKATIRCAPGSRIVNVPKVSYGGAGGGSCSAGGAQYLVEQQCLLQATCEVDVVDAEFDPTDYTCRGIAPADRVLQVTAECATA